MLMRQSAALWQRNAYLPLSLALVLAGAGFVIGVLTPSLCLVCAALLLLAYGFGSVDPWPVPFLITSVLFAVALLGPGAYSIDAWLFGRKKLRIGHISK